MLVHDDCATAPPPPPSRLRTLVEGGVLGFVAVGLLQTWLIDGLVLPYQVAGSSMAGTPAGGSPGRRLRRLRLPLLLRHGRLARGTAGRVSQLRLPGQRPGIACPTWAAITCSIDRAAFSVRPPRRWEIVAFRRSSQADQIVVKRVVGLPGETIEIRHGDVYADGRLLRKNLAQQRALAMLVHDADFPPSARRRPCRRVGGPSGRRARWRAVGGGFTHAAGPDGSSRRLARVPSRASSRR